ncbi:MAG: hypothetical protein MUC73_01645 [Cyclobacteriaceae bacterium]|nr:hypothetical protein [Cyclobacteriaceae bacterium]
MNKLTYSSKTPYLLVIRVNPDTNWASIEFSGKVLLDNYPKLISGDTIAECLSRINDLGICQLSIDSIIHDSTVNKLDVTVDVDFPMNESIKTLLSMAVIDPKKWEAKIKKKNGVDIKKDVKSDSDFKERLIFYDKGDELHRSPNRPFLHALKNPQQVLDFFRGKTRIEYNLTSGVMIRKILEIDSLQLMDVLNSKTQVLVKVCNTIFDRSLIDVKEGKLGFMLFDTIQDYYQNLLLEKHKDDEKEVELVFKHFYSEKSNFRRKRMRLRQIKNIRINSISNISNQLHLFDELLEKIRNAA